MRTKTIPPDLACKFCAVVNYDRTVRFTGRYDECVEFMRDNFSLVVRGLIDLYSAERMLGGYIALCTPMSYVL